MWHWRRELDAGQLKQLQSWALEAAIRFKAQHDATIDTAKQAKFNALKTLLDAGADKTIGANRFTQKKYKIFDNTTLHLLLDAGYKVTKVTSSVLKKDVYLLSGNGITIDPKEYYSNPHEDITSLPDGKGLGFYLSSSHYSGNLTFSILMCDL